MIKSTFYYEDGTVQRIVNFKCKSLHGIQEYFRDDGKLTQTIPYRYGFRNGTGALYDREGKIVEEIVFRNDSLIPDSMLNN